MFCECSLLAIKKMSNVDTVTVLLMTLHLMLLHYIINYRKIIQFNKSIAALLEMSDCGWLLESWVLLHLPHWENVLERLKRFSQCSGDLQTSTISVSPNWAEMCLLFAVHIQWYMVKSDHALYFRCGNINKWLIILRLQGIKG